MCAVCVCLFKFVFFHRIYFCNRLNGADDDKVYANIQTMLLFFGKRQNHVRTVNGSICGTMVLTQASYSCVVILMLISDR